MSDKIKFSYFYGKEAEQFSFYKIPKLLFTDAYFKGLSIEAKVLYGLMLDRMSLSVKNQWIDTEGRAFIYFSVEDIMEMLNCSNSKAIATVKELDGDYGIGLIERKRQGQGKPAIIYVMQFLIQDVQICEIPTSEEKTMISEMGKIHVLKCKNQISRSEDFSCLEVGKVHPNKNKINNTKSNDIKSNPIISAAVMGKDTIRDEVSAYKELLTENLSMSILYQRYPFEQELLDGIFDLILETVLCKSPSIVVAANTYPTEFVKSKFMKLNASHVEYVVDCIKKNTSKVYNIKKYLLAALFNAPSTISGYYQAEVNYDMPGLVCGVDGV